MRRMLCIAHNTCKHWAWHVRGHRHHTSNTSPIQTQPHSSQQLPPKYAHCPRKVSALHWPSHIWLTAHSSCRQEHHSVAMCATDVLTWHLYGLRQDTIITGPLANAVPRRWVAMPTSWKGVDTITITATSANTPNHAMACSRSRRMCDITEPWLLRHAQALDGGVDVLVAPPAAVDDDALP